MSASEIWPATETEDGDWRLACHVKACLDNILQLETYIQDAEQDGDSELAEQFRKAQVYSRKAGELVNDLLCSRRGGLRTGATAFEAAMTLPDV